MKLIPYIEAHNLFEDAKIHYFRCQSFVQDKGSINTYIWKEVWNFCNHHSFGKFNPAFERKHFPYHGVLHDGSLIYYLTHNLYWEGQEHLISEWPNNYHRQYGVEEIRNIGIDLPNEFIFHKGEKRTIPLYGKNGKKFVRIYPNIYVDKKNQITKIDLQEDFVNQDTYTPDFNYTILKNENINTGNVEIYTEISIDKNELADLIDITWGIAHRDINPKQIEQLIREIQHLYSEKLIDIRREYWKYYQLYNEVFEIKGTFNPEQEVSYVVDKEGNIIDEEEDPYFDEKYITLEGLVDPLNFLGATHINNQDTINLFSHLFETQILQIKNLIKEKKAFMYIRDHLTEVNKLLGERYTIKKINNTLQMKYDHEKQVYSGQTTQHEKLNCLKAEYDCLIKHLDMKVFE